MLVLAMEFSRGARRAQRTAAISKQTDDRVRLRTGERPTLSTRESVGVASEGWNRPGLLDEQEPRVAPSKRNSDCPRPTTEPTGLTNGTSEEVRSARGGVRSTVNSQ